MSWTISLPLPLEYLSRGTLSYSNDINNSGQIVGNSDGYYFTSIYSPAVPPPSVLGAAVWQNGGTQGLAPVTSDILAVAYGINNLGEIVGESVSQAGTYQPTAWVNGVAVSLPTFGGPNGIALDVNDSGEIVGSAQLPENYGEACLWQGGSIFILGVLPGGDTGVPGALESRALAINDKSQVVGFSLTGSGFDHAFLSQNGVMTDLGILPGGTESIANAINENGLVVGLATDPSGVTHSVTWQNGIMTELPDLAGSSGNLALSVNATGVIAGESRINGENHAVIWENGTVVDLNSLLPSGSGWVLTSARGINDLGQITGEGLFDNIETEYVLSLGNSATPAVTALAAVQVDQADANFTTMIVADSAANVQANLDGLEALMVKGKLFPITLTDPGIPTLSVGTGQLTADAAAIADISGYFSLSVQVPNGATTITGFSGALGNSLHLNGSAGSYTIIPSGDGTHFVISGNGVADVVSDVQAVQFSDHTVIVAAQPGTGTATTGNIAELYAAVLGRLPDVPGLAYYQGQLATNPTIPLTQFAQWFLDSPEYQNNRAHSYAETLMGDQQFIIDSYENLLHRSPAMSEIAYYENNVIAPMLAGQTSGTTAYAAAQANAHVLVLTYFSQAPEFLADVQVTAQNPASAQHWLVLI